MINEIRAMEGYVFAKADKSEVYDKIIVLGKYDSADNYIQITIEEATMLRELINKRIEEEMANN